MRQVDVIMHVASSLGWVNLPWKDSNQPANHPGFWSLVQGSSSLQAGSHSQLVYCSSWAPFKDNLEHFLKKEVQHQELVTYYVLLCDYNHRCEGAVNKWQYSWFQIGRENQLAVVMPAIYRGISEHSRRFSRQTDGSTMGSGDRLINGSTMGSRDRLFNGSAIGNWHIIKVL